MSWRNWGTTRHAQHANFKAADADGIHVEKTRPPLNMSIQSQVKFFLDLTWY